MTILLSLLLAAAAQEVVPDVRVTGPGRPNSQTPATLVVEPAAMLIVSCDADADGRTTRAELEACLRREFDAIDTAHRGQIGYIDYGRWQTMWLGDQGALPSPFEVDRNSDDMVGYVQVLKQQEFFSGAALVRHEIEAQDPNKPIRFQVEAQWRGR